MYIKIFIIQQIFLQQYILFPCRATSYDIARRGYYCTGPGGILTTTMCFNQNRCIQRASYLVLCGKRQDAALVWIVNILFMHITIIGLHFHSPTARENTTPTHAITRDLHVNCVIDISTTVFSFSHAVHITRYCTAQALLHGLWGYMVSQQPRRPLIKSMHSSYSWEETRCCSGMDNKHFTTRVSMQYHELLHEWVWYFHEPYNKIYIYISA